MQTHEWVKAGEAAKAFVYKDNTAFINWARGHNIPRIPDPNSSGHYLYDLNACRTEKRKALMGEQKQKSRWKGTLGEAEEKLLEASKDALIQQLLGERSRTKAIVAACEQAIVRMPMPPAVPAPPVHKLKGAREEMHLLLSDAQVGQFTDPKTVGNLASYSFEKFCERLDRLAEKIRIFYDLFGANRKIEKLVLHWLGDIVEGESIYKGQPFYIDRIVVDQVFEAVSRFMGFLTFMAGMFPQVENFCVWGNHGRVGNRNDVRHVRDNWDYVFYRTLRIAMREQKNVGFYISESPFMVVEHGQYNFFLTHGDQVRAWMSVPYYGLDRMARKLTGLTGVPINYLQVGHHHRDATASIPRGRWMVNGSFPGGSLLSIDALQEIDFPKQVMYMFHPEEGIHSISDLRLAEEQTLRPKKRGIYTPVYDGE